MRFASHLGEEAQPQHHHFLVAHGVRLELWQFDKHKVKSLNHAVGVPLVHHTVIVVKLVFVGLEDIVDQIQRVNRLQVAEPVTLVELVDVCLGGVEHHALLELGGPLHLHLDDELASVTFAALDVNDAVFAGWSAWRLFRGEIFDRRDFAARLERQQGI